MNKKLEAILSNNVGEAHRQSAEIQKQFQDLRNAVPVPPKVDTPKVSRFELKTFEEDANCPKCCGTMVYSNNKTLPLHINLNTLNRHECNKCRYVAMYAHIYPLTVYERVAT